MPWLENLHKIEEERCVLEPLSPSFFSSPMVFSSKRNFEGESFWFGSLENELVYLV